STPPPPPLSPLFPYTTLFRSQVLEDAYRRTTRRLLDEGLDHVGRSLRGIRHRFLPEPTVERTRRAGRLRHNALQRDPAHVGIARSEEHTSELQSLTNLVCRLL